MKIKCFITIVCFGFMTGGMALDYVEVIDVKARQRYPWNGLVDIDFELDSKATEPYMMRVTVFDNVGKTNLPVKTVYTEKVSQKSNPCMVTKDTTRIVWDAAADLPDGFKCTNVLVTCQDTRCVPVDKQYCVIDISAGSSASSYPVSYLDSVPAGGWTDEYKTTKLVFRKVEPGKFQMGSPQSEIGHQSNESLHWVTLTKGFYIAIFELTERQWTLIMGTQNGGGLTTMRPKAINYSGLISNGGILDVLTAKTGLQKVNIPTEAQWEYACRAGCVRGLNSGMDVSVASMMEVGRCEETGSDGKGGTEYNDASTTVGMYMSNAWGIYDMHGNAGEWVLDLYKEDLGVDDVVDPLITTGVTTGKRIVKGLMTGCYYSYNTGAYMRECRSASRNVPNDNSTYGYYSGPYDDSAHCGPYGIRLIISE